MADDLVFVLFRLTVDKMRGAVSASSGCVIKRSQVVSYLNKITDELKSRQISKELTLKKHSDDVYAYELKKPTKTIFVRIMPTADISYRIGTINEKGQLVDAAKTDSYPAAVKWIQTHEASDPSRHYQLVASLPNVEIPVIVSDVLEQIKSGENNIFVAKASHLGKVNRIDDPNGEYCNKPTKRPELPSVNPNVHILLGRGATIQEFKVEEQKAGAPLLTISVVVSTEGANRPIKAYTDNTGIVHIDAGQNNPNSYWQCGEWIDKNDNGIVESTDTFTPAKNQYCSFAKYTFTVYERSKI